MKLTDDDLIHFGKYKNERLSEVPADYLHWCWTNNVGGKELREYIRENLAALKQEYPDGIWN